MAFRFAPAPFVIVGNPGTAQIVITPAGAVTGQPEIDFTAVSPSGATGFIALTGNTFAMTGPSLPGDTNPPGINLSNTGVGAFGIVNLIGDELLGILYNVGTGGINRNGPLPIILNTTGFGGSGVKWTMCISYHPTVAFTIGVPLNITLPITFPTGEQGGWTWFMSQNEFGSNMELLTMFPGGTHNLVQLQHGSTATVTFALLSVCLYA